MNNEMARRFRLIAKAFAKDEIEYKYFYKTFKKVYSSAKNPAAYYASCVQMADLLTQEKLAALDAHKGENDERDSTEKEAGSIDGANSQPGKED